MNSPTDPADVDTTPEPQADVEPETALPTMAELDRLSVALDDIDDTLDNLDRQA